MSFETWQDFKKILRKGKSSTTLVFDGFNYNLSDSSTAIFIGFRHDDKFEYSASKFNMLRMTLSSLQFDNGCFGMPKFTKI